MINEGLIPQAIRIFYCLLAVVLKREYMYTSKIRYHGNHQRVCITKVLNRFSLMPILCPPPPPPKLIIIIYR
jgi:hypothetical protein